MKQEHIKRVLNQCDWIIWISVVMFLVMRISVLILFSITAEETGADIEAVRTVYEANPLFTALFRLRMFNYMLQFIIIPALMFSIYFLFRRKVLYNRFPIDALQYHSLFLFFVIVFNFVNDVTALLSRIL